MLEGRARLTRGLSVANASVGNIRLGMFIPGFMLAIACIIYIVTLCTIHPESGPRIPRAPDEPPFGAKLMLTALLFLVGSVLT